MTLPTIRPSAPWATLLDGDTRSHIEREALLPFLGQQRWFAGKARHATAAAIADWGVLSAGEEPTFLCLVEVTYADGGRDRYFVPLATSRTPDASRIARDRPANVLARLSGPADGVLHDVLDARVAPLLLEALADHRTLPLRTGEVRAVPTTAFSGLCGSLPVAQLPARRLAGEQSNTSLCYGDRLLLKLLRRVERGLNPEYEIGRHLTERTSFERAPRLAGALEYWSGGQLTTVGVMHELVAHETNAWDDALAHARRFLDHARSRPGPTPREVAGRQHLLAAVARADPDLARATMVGYWERAALLGRRTAELHAALASAAGDPSFGPEPLTGPDCQAFADEMRTRALEAVAALRAALDHLPAQSADLARRLVAAPGPFLRAFASLGGLDHAVSKIRVHGDYHLGQVLCAAGDFVIVDFEGEPLRSIEDRRRRQPALKDVAGMLRSFSYAAYAALPEHAAHEHDEWPRLEPWAQYWAGWASASFLRAYLETAGEAEFVPRSPAALDILLRSFLLDKAFYELTYELSARPDWLRIPLVGMLVL